MATGLRPTRRKRKSSKARFHAAQADALSRAEDFAILRQTLPRERAAMADEAEILKKLLEMSHHEVGGQPADLRDTDVLVTSLIDGSRATVAASLIAPRIVSDGDRAVLRGALLGSALRRRRMILLTKATFDAFTITLPAVALSASLSALIFFNTSALGPVAATYIGVLSFVAAGGLLILRLIWGYRVEQTEADIKVIEAVADLVRR